MIPGANRLRDAHAALDPALGDAYRYGLPAELRGPEPLPLLLALDQKCVVAESEEHPIAGPGLPPFCDGDGRFLSDHCLRMPGG